MKFLSVVTALCFFSLDLYADLASDLLLASDQGRGGIKEGIEWTATIETTEDEETTSRELVIQAQDHDAFVEATKPAKAKGEVYLFNDRQMWFFKSTLKKPVSISPRQKLSGQAANGDIASTHYARDYTATLERTELYNGEKHHILHLKARSNNLTYDQIRYWVSDKTKLATRAEFLTLQGAVFKIGLLEYENKLSLNGKSLPFVSKFTIQDAKFTQNKSVIIYSNPKVRVIAKSRFNVNNLSR